MQNNQRFQHRRANLSRQDLLPAESINPRVPVLGAGIHFFDLIIFVYCNFLFFWKNKKLKITFVKLKIEIENNFSISIFNFYK